MGIRNGAGRRTAAIAAARLPIAPGTVRATGPGRLTGAVSTATAGTGDAIEVALANTR
ncbi:hypothetical protein [Actinokineospora pegani]|uniref:hypothetical protein n=1 Tax=Actinokineospora pegani TaxID=2654637 RepID=UPI0012EA657F|nr:hypothetical protein [Actinokineospora pegani]